MLRRDPLDRDAFAFLDAFYRRDSSTRSARRAARAQRRAEALPLHVRIARLREAAEHLRGAAQGLPTPRSAASAGSPSSIPRATTCCARTSACSSAPSAGTISRGCSRPKSRAAPGRSQAAAAASAWRAAPRAARDRAAAADALERMLMLRPDDRALRDALIEDLLALARYEDALPLLERKVEEAATQPQKLALLQQIAALCRGKLQRSGPRVRGLRAHVGAGARRRRHVRDAWPNSTKQAATSSACWQRSSARPRSRRARQRPRLARMAKVAEQRLEDAERAGDLLSRAVDVAPEQPEPTCTRCASCTSACERYDDLVELLRERVLMERNPRARSSCYRAIAQVLGERLETPKARTTPGSNCSKSGGPRSAARAAAARARDRRRRGPGRHPRRLAALEPDPREKRDLLFDRARLLSARLSAAGRGAARSRAHPDRVRSRLRARDPRAGAASEAAGDYSGLARVLEQRLTPRVSPTRRIDYARRLADVCEQS